LALVVIVTLTSTLFAGGVILIKQQLEAVIFGDMVRDQLQVLSQQLDNDAFSEAALFENWTFYFDSTTASVPAEFRSLEEGSHHSITVGENYYQVEVANRDGDKIFLSYDITEWENQEHRTLELLAYGIGFVALAAIFYGMAGFQSSACAGYFTDRTGFGYSAKATQREIVRRVSGQ
tara:strand:- start:65394 stop:65924 length:531 start_codon:yes stop_codon:yes gene_type:complete